MLIEVEYLDLQPQKESRQMDICRVVWEEMILMQKI
jgi:hypothetical protein